MLDLLVMVVDFALDLPLGPALNLAVVFTVFFAVVVVLDSSKDCGDSGEILEVEVALVATATRRSSSGTCFSTWPVRSNVEEER
jgi:hypothetical protein